MDIEFNCYKCGQPISIDEKGAGCYVNCPNCMAKITVPAKTSISPSAIQTSQATVLSGALKFLLIINMICLSWVSVKLLNIEKKLGEQKKPPVSDFNQFRDSFKAIENLLKEHDPDLGGLGGLLSPLGGDYSPANIKEAIDDLDDKLIGLQSALDDIQFEVQGLSNRGY